MNAELSRIFQQLETQRNQILSDVSRISAENYALSKNGKWSVSQILTHLLASERLSLGYMKKKSLGVDSLDDSGILEALRYNLLKASQRISFLKYKVPKIVAEHTPPALSLDELKKEWQQTRIELQEFLTQIDQKNLRKKIYKHPAAGRLNVMQACGFLGDHIHHHLPQIKRLL